LVRRHGRFKTPINGEKYQEESDGRSKIFHIEGLAFKTDPIKICNFNRIKYNIIGSTTIIVGFRLFE